MKQSITKITATLALTCLLSAPSLADELKQKQSKNELIGFGSGAVVGTLIAGPLGGMVTGLIGLLIAEDVNSDEELKLAQSSLSEKNQTILAMQSEFEQAKQVAMVQIASLNQALEKQSPQIESLIQFKTASHVLEKHYTSQLDSVAQTLLNDPQLTVRLSGFADQRGDDDLNQALSEQRTISVRDYLINKGVNKEQVLTNSYGESSLVSTGSNFEDDFFDRRVHLKVTDKHTAIAAANQ
ncbi:sortase-associated OmpA-like protein PdsO [Paraglaciecola aquimarina]|uniref:Sortase-associated OmpA-like protein PdsO n=1 Tax=Paraglaciecola aquimarina TaxID=1235557 RepID=A0ABU3SUN5_9ALTE|nr:sortase-associated OmpA-like protein PdsO [Paraglaciecola aquimarina]MDU0353703.1 sortase-associated OmpA-like protein PdsO [Paraglaciecola aquimarina]